MSYDDLKSGLFSHSENYILATHISPDSDAIGSVVGLYLALKGEGKEVSLYLNDGMPNRFVGLVPDDLKYITSVPDSDFIFIGVDCATKKRLGDLSEDLVARSRMSYNIDHHTSNELWAKLNYIDAVSPATACIIYKLLDELKINISSEMASLLYAGILDDTGFFRFSNTTPDSLSIAGKLVELGARPADISNIIHFNVPKRVVNLRAAALNTLQFYLNDRVAMLNVTRAMLDQTGCKSEESEGLVDLARGVEGVDLAFFIREMDDKLKVSCRAKTEEFDVNQLAGKFGGGGHKMASGFTFEGSLENCKSALLKEVAKLL